MFTNSRKCTYIFTVAANKGAPAFKLDRADWQKFQLHFFEYPQTTPLLQIGATSVTPGFYGEYDSALTGGETNAVAKYYPSPLSNAQGDYPFSTAKIGWSRASGASEALDMDFPMPDAAQLTILPGSIGQLGYFRKEEGPFKGDAESFIEMDSGILFSDWDRWQVAYDVFEHKKRCTYTPLKNAYNTKVTSELRRLADPFASPRSSTGANALPARPCKPDRPYKYTGPDVQWTNAWTAIKASATFRGQA